MRSARTKHFKKKRLQSFIKNQTVCLLPLIFYISCSNPVKQDNMDGQGAVKAMYDMGAYMVLKSDGTLWSWGTNITGVLGHGTKESESLPRQISSVSGIVDFSLSHGICTAADSDGNIWYWGSVLHASVVPTPTILSPKRISCLPGLLKVFDRGFLLRSDGTLWQLDVDPQLRLNFSVPERIKGMNNIVSVSGSLAVTSDGVLLEAAPSQEPGWGGHVPVLHVADVQNSISHTAVLKKDGTVWAWGQNSIGELGNGTYENSAIPVRVYGLSNVIQISINYHYNLALKKDGSVWFWGFTGLRDELTDQPVGINMPVKIENLDNVIYIHAHFKCIAIKDDGSVWIFDAKERTVEEVKI